MVVDKAGEPAGKTTQTDTSSNAQSRQVAGAAKRKARARSPSPKTAYPSAFSQRRPPSRMNQTFGPNRTDPSNAIFIPRQALVRRPPRRSRARRRQRDRAMRGRSEPKAITKLESANRRDEASKRSKCERRLYSTRGRRTETPWVAAAAG